MGEIMRRHKDSVARQKTERTKSRGSRAGSAKGKETAKAKKNTEAKTEDKDKPKRVPKKKARPLITLCQWTTQTAELSTGTAALSERPCVGYCTGYDTAHACACPRFTRCGKTVGSIDKPAHFLVLKSNWDTTTGPFCWTCQVVLFHRHYWMR